MKKYIAFFLVLIALPIFAQEKRSSGSIGANKDLKAEIDRVNRLSGNRLSVLQLNSGGLPQLIRGTVSVQEPIVAIADRSSAAAVTSSVANYMEVEGRQVLGLNNDASVVHAATNQVSSIWHSAFKVQYNGIPLRDRMIHVHTGTENGKVVLLRSNIPSGEPNIATPFITDVTAAETAERTYSNGGSVPFTISELPKLVYVNLPNPTEVRLAWETILSDGFHQWRYTIDADNANVLEVRDMVVCNFSMEELRPGQYGDIDINEPLQELATPQSKPQASLEAVSGRVLAKVHLTQPTDTQTTVGLGGVYVTVNSQQYVTDSMGNWSANTTYPVVVQTKFSGPYFTTTRKDSVQKNGNISKTVQSGSLDLLWDDANSHPAERDVTYTVNLARDHVIGVDTALKGINSRLTLNVNLAQTCNAYYDPGNRSLNFFAAGGGCANTGEILDVIAHEFGHRVNHVRYIAAGADYMNDKSLDEGFADLSSNFLRDDPVIGKGFNGKNTKLRTSDNTTMWPKDISADGHMTGVIISGAVWDLRKLIGHDQAERLYDLCGYLAPDGIGYNDPVSIKLLFTEVLAAFLSVDDDDGDLTNGTPHAAEILKAFQMHNIGIQNYFDMDITPIADGSALDAGYSVKVYAPYTGAVGSRNDDSVKIHYSTNGTTYNEQVLTHDKGDYFIGSIPKVASPAVVKYYGSAGTNYTNAGSAIFPLYTTQGFSFLVGYNSKSIDNCETDNGWTFSKSGTTTGIWTLDQPVGTYDDFGNSIQQDSDHSQNGTSCVLTGVDDAIETGTSSITTTAVSPAIDVSGLNSPAIRFWYYYTNDQGFFGGTAIFKLYAASNGGTSYKLINTTTTSPSIQGTTLTTKGWKPFVIKVKDVLGNGVNTVKIRAVASGNIPKQTYPDQQPPQSGHIIEAGLDDIEVLDNAPLGVADAATTEPTAISPNPATPGRPITMASSKIGDGSITYELYNGLGALVASGTSEAFSSQSIITLPQSIASGMYQIILKSGSSTLYYHFMIVSK
jgi:hypothetical protein